MSPSREIIQHATTLDAIIGVKTIMYESSRIDSIHLEITSRCNAGCPQCARNIQGGRTIPGLPVTELTLGDVQRILPGDLIRRLNMLYACGVYGDPMVAQDTLDIFRYLRAENPSIKLSMDTNGSAKSVSWWSSLARVINCCTFGIDGLEDTHAIYRRGTDWNVVIRNARAFIEAGGTANWAFIVFKHNEHQVETARQLSQEIGFAKFMPRKTSRFLNGSEVKSGTPVLDRYGNIEYIIYPPENDSLRNSSLITLQNVGDYRTYERTTPIQCKAVSKKRIYISAEGLVLPCCWMGKLYRGDTQCPSESMALILKSPGGRDAIDAKQHPIESILSTPLFKTVIPKHWEPNHPDRLRICARMCGAVDLTVEQ